MTALLLATMLALRPGTRPRWSLLMAIGWSHQRGERQHRPSRQELHLDVAESYPLLAVSL